MSSLCYILSSWWWWLLSYCCSIAPGFSKVSFAQCRSGVKHFAWRVSSSVYILIAFPVNTPYPGVGKSKDKAGQEAQIPSTAPFPQTLGSSRSTAISLVIYFRSVPAGGDNWLWVICVLNITGRILGECYLSWVMDWLVTCMSCDAQLVYRFE